MGIHLRTPSAITRLATLVSLVVAGYGSTASAALNPNLNPTCGTRVILVLDESGSIQDTAGAESGVRNAANAFAAGLADTGSDLAIIEFGSRAKRVFGYTPVTSGTDGTLTTRFQPYLNATATAPADVYDSPSQLGGFTNWQDALEEVKLLNAASGVAPLVVFITDGDPNTINTAAGGVQTGVPAATALPPAVVEADAVKAQGSHILAVGVGASLNNASSLNRLVAISDGDVASTPGAINLATTDVLRIVDFSTLATALRTLVNQLCQGSLTVNKEVIDGQTVTDGGAGWVFTANAAVPGGYTWITPQPGAAGPRTTTTAADSAATFQWKPNSPTTASVSVSEPTRLGYTYVGTTCTTRSAANPTPRPLPITQTGSSFTADVGPTDIATCTVRNRKLNPSVAIVKTVDKPTVLAGTLVTYTIRVTNTGDVPLSNVTVADPVASSCARAIGTLAVAGVSQYTCVASIDQDTTNTATVTTTDPQGTAVPPRQATARVDVIAPKIEITKTVDKPTVVAGTVVTWTVTVRNSGDVPLTNVAVSDPVAPGCARVVASLAVGASNTATCTGTITQATTNIATVEASDPLGNPLPPATDTATVTVISPALAITKTVDRPTVLAGTEVTWTIRVSNTGDVPLTNVVVSDPQTAPGCQATLPSLAVGATSDPITCRQTIDADTTNVTTASATNPVGGAVGPVSASASVDVIAPNLEITKSVNQPVVLSGTAVTWTVTVRNTGDVPLTNIRVTDPLVPSCAQVIPTLAPGAAAPPITCTSTITAATNNVATVTGTDPLGNDLPPKSADAPVNVISPGLSITKSVDKPVVLAGTQVTWTLTVRNTGDVPLTNVRIADPSAPGCETLIPALAAGATAPPITCVGQITTDTTNTATVTGTDPLGNPVGPASAVSSVDVISPGIAVAKSVDRTQVAPGTQVTYTITVRNIGDAPLSDVVVADPTTPACARDIGNLPVGQSATYACTATVNADTTNVATATGADPLRNRVTATDSVAVTVTPSVVTPPTTPPPVVVGAEQTRLRITKSGPPSARRRETITYTVRITNTGTVAAQNVVLRDRLPRSMSLARRVPNGRLVRGELVVQIGTLAPGQTRTVSVRLRIDRRATGIRRNVATATASNAATVTASARTRIRVIIGLPAPPPVTG